MHANLDRTISGFTTQYLIGEGGMAFVYYAENSLKLPAAVKILKPQFSHDFDLRARFLQEASTLVRLKHQNIRRVYDASEPNLAIIMEYLEGMDLRTYVEKKGEVPEIQVKAWLEQLLPALQHAHDQGVIHRDIKPSNIFLNTEGKLFLMDFGIAKIMGELTQTKTGMALGSPLYMSPEQIITPQNIDHRTDWYSLGVTIYHLLSGHKPYDEDSLSLFEIQTDITQKSLSHLDHCSATMNTFIQQLTAKDRNKRSLLELSTLSRATPPSGAYDQNTLYQTPRVQPENKGASSTYTKPNDQNTAQQKDVRVETKPVPEKNNNLAKILGVGFVVLILVVLGANYLMQRSDEPIENPVVYQDTADHGPQRLDDNPVNDNPVIENPTPSQAYAQIKTRLGSDLRLRTEADENAGIITTIPNGKTVEVVRYATESSVVDGESGKWVLVRYGEYEGWCWGVYLTRL